MKTNPDDAAFLKQEFSDGSRPPPGMPSRIGRINPGLTKREWFAGLALQGLLAGPDFHLMPVPQPFKNWLIVVLILIFVIYLLNFIGFVHLDLR